MKPFTINRNSWHYKLNKNFFNDYQHHMGYWEAKHDNFCSYWRVTTFRLVFALTGSTFFLLVFSMISVGMYQDPLKALIIVGIPVGLFSAVFGIFLFSMYLDDLNRKNEDIADSLFVAKYKSYKSKVCPMVDYDK